MNGQELAHDLELNLGIERLPKNRELLLQLVNFTLLKAKAYCRLSALPEDMRPLIVEIAADRYRRQSIGQSSERATVSSVTDGDQSVGYKTAATEPVLSTGFTESEQNMLNLFRKAW